ncbi:glycosyltransferase [Botrimarina hoheduenensis]|uniref:GDP-mannose-dependent alpha-(1-6)-phosphatidylinositol monomannoside mannosyltransferase n=1 Tax=Botrimarina hoheduenensis TaxID=2528000 RepID=A0A5C5W6D2_9BACT|nr:glycosyltransferase [Botrimarina hoheduenensis]TWT46446.1 GDP-mannose-dependent alpha-(1-6)-phosphatidylinositol monomannoside mannosyltransferase [Botrimarina hoheduenensis]
MLDTEGIKANLPRPIRCLHDVGPLRLEAGGVVRAVLDLVEGLARAGSEVTLATSDPADVPPEWAQSDRRFPRVVTHDRRMSPLLRPRGSANDLARLIAGAEVLHLHTPWDPFNLAIAAAARAAGRPYIVSVHGMLDDWCMAGKAFKKRLFLAAAGCRMLEGAARVHFTAEAERDQAMKWIPGARPVVLPLLMDTSPYGSLPGPQAAREAFPAIAEAEVAGEPRLLFLSRVDPKKGIDLLIRAVATLAASGQPTHALIAGPGDPAYVATLQRLAESLGVAGRIHFLGMVRGELKWSLYQACDVFVLPTHQENFGIVLVEAMGCGLPTLTTRQVDIWREIERCGARITEDSSAPITQTLGEMLADLPAARSAAANGRERLLGWLDPDRLADEYLALYAQVVAEAS